jgi:hypothetical protein
MLALSLFAPDGTLSSFNAAQSKTFLMQELGLNLQMTQEKSIGVAIESPGKFIATRELAIEAAAETAGTALSAYQTKLLKAGMSTTEAREISLQYAKQIYDSEMAIFNLATPGYQQAVGKAVVRREGKEARSNLYFSDRKAYKKAVLEKDAAKRAAK